MPALLQHRRLAAAAAALAVATGPLAGGGLTAPSGAAPARTATTSVDTTYLQDTLGLPAETVVEPVTYDRFQWLLQQPGQFAFLVGSVSDGFKAKAVATDAAARAAGVGKVYWFDPNLSGYPDARNLDTRNPAAINLAPAAQTIFGNTWRNLLGQYLGNGIGAVPNAAQTSVTVAADDTVVNDAVDPVFDYRGGATPAAATHDVFFVYDKDRTAGAEKDKIADWVDLTVADAAAVPAEVTTAVATVGGASVDQLSQFAWWKSSANRKHDTAYPDDARYGGDILTDADDADGWRIKQVTYPELLHLLKLQDSADRNFVILFGGTWCHNTRAVLKDVNAQAQRNGVTTVYNFDLVLDGGTTNGTNGGANPIHARDNATGSGTRNFRPSHLYGDVVRTYLRNLITEYDPNTGNRVAYYPGGDATADLDVVRKLQVPFLVNYQRGTAASPSSTSIKRQWIQQGTDASTGLPTFREYMSEWWFTHPSAQLGLGFPITDEAALTDAQRSQLVQARASLAFGQEALARLRTFFGGLPGAVVAEATVTAPSVAYGSAPRVTVAIANEYGRVPAGNATLTVAGRTYTQKVSQNAASFTVGALAPGSYPFTVSYAGDDQVVGFEKPGTLVVTKGVVAGTSGAVVKAPRPGRTGTYRVTVAAPAGLAPATGTVTVTLTKGKARKVVTGTLVAGAGTLRLPKLPRGTWKVALAYAGDASYLAAGGAGAPVKVKR